MIEVLGSVVQIAAGPSYILSVTENGEVHSFGSGANFCLGHGEQHDELQPRAIQKFRRKGIHIVRVSAGDEHAVALDSNGFVSLIGQDKFPLLFVILGLDYLRACGNDAKDFVIDGPGIHMGQGILWCFRPWR